MNNLIVKITETAAFLISKYVSKGDIVIDATMGNGNDTMLLAELVGDGGKVYAFDIQDEAIAATEKLLRENRLLKPNIFLIKDSHENVDNYVHDAVAAAIFNLGYLPGGKKEITTGGQSTLIALDKILKLLKKGGIASILIYSGHEEGKKEKAILMEYLKNLDNKLFHVIDIEMINQKNDPPNLVMVTRKY